MKTKKLTDWKFWEIYEIQWKLKSSWTESFEKFTKYSECKNAYGLKVLRNLQNIMNTKKLTNWKFWEVYEIQWKLKHLQTESFGKFVKHNDYKTFWDPQQTTTQLYPTVW